MTESRRRSEGQGGREGGGGMRRGERYRSPDQEECAEDIMIVTLHVGIHFDLKGGEDYYTRTKRRTRREREGEAQGENDHSIWGRLRNERFFVTDLALAFSFGNLILPDLYAACHATSQKKIACRKHRVKYWIFIVDFVRELPRSTLCRSNFHT